MIEEKISLDSKNHKTNECLLIIYIYTLTNPINGQVFYVGKTTDLKSRFMKHTSPNNKETNNKSAIIRYLLLD